MKINYLPSSGKSVWLQNKAFIGFLLSLLLIYSVLKIIFYIYNYPVLFTVAELNNPVAHKLSLIKWSLLYDLFTLLLINSVLLLLLQAGRLLSQKISSRLILPVFVLINSLAVLLNLADIFYFRFHAQRANADLLYVLDHPFKQLFHQSFIIITAFFAGIAVTVILMWWLHKKFYLSFLSGRHCLFTSYVLLGCLGLSFLFRNNFSRFILPAYPLIELKSNQLPAVQNSFHTFLYSVFRTGGKVNPKQYFSAAACDSFFSIKKTLQHGNKDSVKRNIVLFIMESVPYDFFDPTGPYNVAMPFFDSILKKSSFYTNAFGYSHESNKGIAAILAGIPTLTDIPLYHSPYINMPFTKIGAALRKNNYHTFFCIGDDYDNFGFAKCLNWMEIDNYYSKEDIPGYKNLPAHSMGLQDEYVLDFMHQKINTSAPPFFAINYNISTHYPYDLPASFKKSFPVNYTSPMKSMSYYDHCLQSFFNNIKNESWFSHTVFIFCSDHWMAPDDNNIRFNALTGYRIPLIIFDPSGNERKINKKLSSQFDVMGTILALSGYPDSVITYGVNLLDSSSNNEFVISRANAYLYQVIDSAYILGFNNNNDKAEFLFHYTTDTALSHNLVLEKAAQTILTRLTLKAEAFLQKANTQYYNGSFK